MSLYNNKFYLFANWKMYLDYDESNIVANALAADKKKIPANVLMAIFPSALSFYPVTQVLSDVGVQTGAQNAHWVDKGGYTGEVSVDMYKDSGAKYVLIGHSERRHLFHETEHETREKMEAVIAAGLTPVLCVGETEEERANKKTEEVVDSQVIAALDGLNSNGKEMIIAYEPVWAIGTGEACDPDEAERVQTRIYELAKKYVPEEKIVLLYGGSVRPNNVGEYLGMPHVNGVLVGSSSAKLESWNGIMDAAGAIK